MKVLFLGCAVLAFGTCLASAPGRGAFERNLSVNGPVELDVLSDIGGVILKVGPSDTVRVRAVLTPQFGPLDIVKATERIETLERNPPIEQDGNRIRIGYPADPQLLTRISMRLEIEAPRATSIAARTGSGGIRIDGVAGSVNGESRSGRIVLADIEGDVSVRTQSGGIFVERADGKLSAQNGSGGIEATAISGAIEAATGSGAIRLSQTKPAAIRAYARSGAIFVGLADGGGYDFVARSESGRLSIPDAPTSSEKNPRRLAGKLAGGGPLIDLSTRSSSISIRR